MRKAEADAQVPDHERQEQDEEKDPFFKMSVLGLKHLHDLDLSSGSQKGRNLQAPGSALRKGFRLPGSSDIAQDKTRVSTSVPSV
jgi:hypothetical protein